MVSEWLLMNLLMARTQILSPLLICFQIRRFYAVMGASESGKTTLLLLLEGLDVPTEGSVSFNGTATGNLDCDDYRLEHVSVIYQNYNLFPYLTALETRRTLCTCTTPPGSRQTPWEGISCCRWD